MATEERFPPNCADGTCKECKPCFDKWIAESVRAQIEREEEAARRQWAINEEGRLGRIDGLGAGGVVLGTTPNGEPWQGKRLIYLDRKDADALTELQKPFRARAHSMRGRWSVDGETGQLVRWPDSQDLNAPCKALDGSERVPMFHSPLSIKEGKLLDEKLEKAWMYEDLQS